MEGVVYNQKGAEAGKVKLPEKIFGAKWNEALVHQVVVGMMSNSRTPIAHTKNRGEVSGTGKKPWRQKGTGRARHGSRRSPIWVGGGVAHGPRNDKNYARKINKKMRAQALWSVLSKKWSEGQVVFLDNLALVKPQTKEAKKILASLSKVKGLEGVNRRKNAAFIALAGADQNTEKSFRNFGNVELGLTKDLNPVDLLTYRYLVIADPEKSIAALSARAK